MRKLALTAPLLLSACVLDHRDDTADPPGISASLADGVFDPGAGTWTSNLRVANADDYAVFVEPANPDLESTQADLLECTSIEGAVNCAVAVPFASSDEGSDLYIWASNDADDVYLHAGWLPIVPR